MSYEVKPEDISNEVVRQCSDVSSWTENLDDTEIASIANILIEAGLVSPPCHVRRKKDGTLDKFLINGEVRVWVGKPVISIFEHYRGQIE